MSAGALLLVAGLLAAACSSPEQPLPAVREPAALSAGEEAPRARVPQKPKAPDTSELRLVFSDEFEGHGLDTSRWQTDLPWGPISNMQELQYYSPGQLQVGKGLLTITAEKKRTGNRPYTSGLISTYDTLEFTYGYVEVRSRSVRGQGLWPALWLMAAPERNFNEIDIAEFVGQNPYRTQMTLHWGPTKQRISGMYTGPDFAADFHTHAVAWKPDSIVWYIDGVERYRLTDHVPHIKMYLVANLAVGGNYAGPPDATTGFPTDYQIDYIRVYSWK